MLNFLKVCPPSGRGNRWLIIIFNLTLTRLLMLASKLSKDSLRTILKAHRFKTLLWIVRGLLTRVSLKHLILAITLKISRRTWITANASLGRTINLWYTEATALSIVIILTLNRQLTLNHPPIWMRGIWLLWRIGLPRSLLNKSKAKPILRISIKIHLIKEPVSVYGWITGKIIWIDTNRSTNTRFSICISYRKKL